MFSNLNRSKESLTTEIQDFKVLNWGLFIFWNFLLNRIFESLDFYNAFIVIEKIRLIFFFLEFLTIGFCWNTTLLLSIIVRNVGSLSLRGIVLNFSWGLNIYVVFWLLSVRIFWICFLALHVIFKTNESRKFHLLLFFNSQA